MQIYDGIFLRHMVRIFLIFYHFLIHGLGAAVIIVKYLFIAGIKHIYKTQLLTKYISLLQAYFQVSRPPTLHYIIMHDTKRAQMDKKMMMMIIIIIIIIKIIIIIIIIILMIIIVVIIIIIMKLFKFAQTESEI